MTEKPSFLRVTTTTEKSSLLVAIYSWEEADSRAHFTSKYPDKEGRGTHNY
jgi:hypothetical protein